MLLLGILMAAFSVLSRAETTPDPEKIAAEEKWKKEEEERKRVLEEREQEFKKSKEKEKAWEQEFELRQKEIDERQKAIELRKNEDSEWLKKYENERKLRDQLDETIKEKLESLVKKKERKEKLRSLRREQRKKEEKRIKEEVSRLTAQLNQSPDDYDLLWRLGLNYQKLGIVNRSIEKFQESLRLRPEFSLSRYHLAIAYDEKNDGKNALKNMKRAERLIVKQTEFWDKEWVKRLARSRKYIRDFKIKYASQLKKKKTD